MKIIEVQNGVTWYREIPFISQKSITRSVGCYYYVTVFKYYISFIIIFIVKPSHQAKPTIYDKLNEQISRRMWMIIMTKTIENQLLSFFSTITVFHILFRSCFIALLAFTWFPLKLVCNSVFHLISTKRAKYIFYWFFVLHSVCWYTITL